MDITTWDLRDIFEQLAFEDHCREIIELDLINTADPNTNN